MKTKHTPGPWETADPFPDLDKRACVYWQIIRDQNNNILAEVKGDHYGTKNIVAEANAKLIAAAPKTTERLIESTEWLMKMRSAEILSEQQQSDLEDIIIKNDLIIKKATS